MRIAFPLTLAWMLGLSLWACQSSRSGGAAEADLNRLTRLMTGTFSNEAQARRDSHYRPIALHMQPIWPDKGAWMYVEQALASQPDHPYRQRIYHLEQLAAGRFRSVIYTLPQPDQYVGAWRQPERFATLSPLQLELRSGCDIYLDKTGKQTFSGSTRGKTCQSTLNGASYATSEVTIRKQAIITWDRGWNAQGQQVWGPEEGGYVFRRQ